MEQAALVIAAVALGWSIAWSIFEFRARRRGDVTASDLAQQAVSESRRAADAAERSAVAAETATALDVSETEAARRADLRVLFWESRARTDTGPGLVVHNIGRASAHDIVGFRLMPTGVFEQSSALKVLNPGEQRGINPGWEAATAPTDVPMPSSGRYVARVTWLDAAGEHQTDWKEIEKR